MKAFKIRHQLINIKTIFTIYLLICILGSIGCRKDEIEELQDTPENTINRPANIERLDIVNARVLLIVDEDIDSNVIRKLYMIDTNEELKQVKIQTDTDSNFYLNNEIENAYDINKNFFALKTKDGNRNYLILKSSGEAYSIDDIGEMELNFYYYGDFSKEVITSDKYGNIYFKDKVTYQILRVDVSDLNKITHEIASFEEDKIYEPDEFTVDYEGNVVYEGEYNNESIHRAVSYDKSEVRLLPGKYISYEFRGADGFIYYDYGYLQLSKIRFNPLTVTNYLNIYLDVNSNAKILRIANKKTNVFIEEGSIIQISNIDSSITSVREHNIYEIIHAKSNRNYYFLAQRTMDNLVTLYMVNPDNPVLTILSQGTNAISSFDVTENNTVYFKAFNSSYLKFVIGRVSPSGDIKIINEDFTHKIIFLAITNLN